MSGRWFLHAVCLSVAAISMASAWAQTSPPTVEVYAAGSLRAALSDVLLAFEHAQPARLTMTYGASGMLKDRIVAGASPQVFASANMEHPQALVAAGRASAVSPFARNQLCVLAKPEFSLRGKTLPQRLLDADVRVGTSTPKADPSGDYAFAMFDRIEASGAAGPGSAPGLKAKALQLTGGPDSPPPPQGTNVYGQLISTGRADVFVTYCTNAATARRERPDLQVLPVPDEINVSARYGVALLDPDNADALAYLQFLLGPKGQQILASHGFGAP